MSMWQHQLLPFRFLISGHLPRESRQSRLSVNKCYRDVEPAAVCRYPGTFFAVEKNPGKNLVMRTSEGYTTTRRFKWGPVLPNEVTIAQLLVGLNGRKIRKSDEQRQACCPCSHVLRIKKF